MTDEVGHMLQPGMILATLVYAIIGMLFLLIAYKIFDLVNPLDFTKELEKNNQALGTVIAGFFIAIAIVVGAAIHG